MPYDVRIAERVLNDDLPNLPGKVVDDLLGDPEDPDDEGKVKALAEDPSMGRPLTGSLKGLWRMPLCGGYRVIYAILVPQGLVGIIMVGIRREATKGDVYNRLTGLLYRVSVEQMRAETMPAQRAVQPAAKSALGSKPQRPLP